MENNIVRNMISIASEVQYKYCNKIIDEIAKYQKVNFSKELNDYQQIILTSQYTSESIYILLGENRIWDAEILFRTVLEGTIKLFKLWFKRRKI